MKKQENRIAEAQPNPPAAAPVEKTKRTAPTLEFLAVPYTDAEILAMAESMARYESDKEQLEEQFEVIKLDFKHKLEAVDASVKSISRKIRKRAHYENVDCIYVLEEPTNSEKTLVRMDTGEVVRVVPMDPRDYQDPLPSAMKPATDPVDNTSFSLTPAADRKTAAAGEDSRPQ